MKSRALALVATVTAASVAVPVGSALAATTTFHDPHTSAKASSDIRWVKVTNDRNTNDFKVKARVDKVRIGSTLVVYVDRNQGNNGPELRMVAAPDSEWALYRVHRWGERGKQIDTCGRVRLSAGAHDHRATWKASRSCLNIDGAVRVGVKMVDPDGDADWAPKARTFYPRVTAKY